VETNRFRKDKLFKILLFSSVKNVIKEKCDFFSSFSVVPFISFVVVILVLATRG